MPRALSLPLVIREIGLNFKHVRDHLNIWIVIVRFIGALVGGLIGESVWTFENLRKKRLEELTNTLVLITISAVIAISVN